jgi:hypothetical protein
MSTMKMTIYGLNNYMASVQDDLFSGLTLPTGITKNVVVKNILKESADFETLYSDPYFLQELITNWSAKWYDTFEKWYNALQIQYDPLNNFDRHEEWEDVGTSASTNIGTGSVSNKSKTEETPSGKMIQKHFVTPYESNVETLQGSDETSYENYKDTTETNTTSGTNTSNTGTGNTTGKHKGHLYGNIGVTTSQQMLEAELEIATWNLVQHITDIFIKEFCILVY